VAREESRCAGEGVARGERLFKPNNRVDMLNRPLLSLRSFWWRGLLGYIGLPCLLILRMDWSAALPILGVVIGLNVVLVLLRDRWLWRLTRQVWRFHTKTTDRVLLHYPAALESRFDWPVLLGSCESDLDDLEKWFGFALRRRVAIFMLESKASVREVLGRPFAGYALTTANAMVIGADAGLGELIRHELAHLFSSRWAQMPRPLFSEGLAVWLQRTWDGVPLDSVALRLLRHRAPQLSDLLSHRFFFSVSNRRTCYVLAGSFTGFLIRRFGKDAYRKFYRKSDALNFHAYFRKIFGISFEKAEWRWRTELQAMAVLNERLKSHIH
jgi:hypothetical protein